MALMAPVSGFSLGALDRFSAGLPLPQGAAPSRAQPVSADAIVFSSAPSRILSDLASAGLRQLATLLPMLEQAVQGHGPVPLVQLAKAAGAAARHIGDGTEALLAEGPDRVVASIRSLPASDAAPTDAMPDSKLLLRSLVRQIGAEIDADSAETGRSAGPSEASNDLRSLARRIGAEIESAPHAEPDSSPLQRWVDEARHLLRSTGEALDRAEAQTRPLAAAEPIGAAGMPTAWVLTEILVAQAQIGTATRAVDRAHVAARASLRIASRPLSIHHLGSATTLLGMLLVLAALWFVGGLWSAATGIVALGGAAMWVWRLSQATRGVTLDVRG